MLPMGVTSLYVVAVNVLLLPCSVTQMSGPQANNNTTRLSLLNSLLRKEKYDSRVPPDYEKNVPTNVTISILLLSFNSVSETRMDYSVELFLTQEWIDERLHFANISSELKWLEVDSKMMSDVWVPDVYFRNEKSASFHDVTVPNKFMHQYPGGRVVYSVRLSMTLNCRMNLIKYPLDSQKCPMWIQSYTYTTENVMFSWSKEPIAFDVEMQVHTELPQFSIVKNITTSCQKVNASKDDLSFACIVAKFTLQRDIGYYIIQVYVPSILIVALSWVSFWLDVEAIPARVSLGVLTVLTLNTHGSTIQSTLPKVSYIKAIDVWVVSGLIFVFAALLEFAYVNVLARRADKELAMAEVLALSQLQIRYQRANQTNAVSPVFQTLYPPSSSSSTSSTSLGGMDEANGTGGPKEVVRKVNGEMSRHILVQGETSSRARARRVDKISRIVFPLCFVVFNLIYWTVYVNLDVKDQ